MPYVSWVRDSKSEDKAGLCDCMEATIKLLKKNFQPLAVGSFSIKFENYPNRCIKMSKQIWCYLQSGDADEVRASLWGHMETEINKCQKTLPFGSFSNKVLNFQKSS